MPWLNDSRRLELGFWLCAYVPYFVFWLLIAFCSPYGPLVNLSATVGTSVLYMVSIRANAERYGRGLRRLALKRYHQEVIRALS